MKRRLLAVSLAVIIVLGLGLTGLPAPPAMAQPPIYVDADAPGANNGTSWEFLLYVFMQLYRIR